MVEGTGHCDILSATECSPKNLLFSHVSLMAIFAEVTENECIIKRHLCDPSKSANVTSTSEIVRDRGRDNCSMWTLVSVNIRLLWVFDL